MGAIAPELEGEKQKSNNLILQLAEVNEALEVMKAKYDNV
jgi:hypothetical protein